jgi:integrase
MASNTSRTRRTKPDKPYDGFPLTIHPNGQYSKKIYGVVHYFGSWEAGWQAALEAFNAKKDYLYAGQAPPITATLLRDVLNSFRRTKERALEQGRLSQRSFDEYEEVTDTVASTLGASRPIESITTDELARLRSALVKGKSGKSISPTSQKRILTYARSVFYHANEECGCSIRYKKPLASPSAKQLRKHRHEVGERLFSAEEIRGLLAIAKPQLKAMILLGINCGFGNRDCATLPIEQVNLATSWHTYWRPKTQTPRRAPLWPETAAALYAVIKNRNSGLVFRTKAGNPWYTDDKRRCPISYEFRKLLVKLGIYRSGITTFYTLRRTFETVGELAGEPKALQFMMGHTPATDDMSAVYRQRHWDASLAKVTDQVHAWLFSNDQSGASGFRLVAS